MSNSSDQNKKGVNWDHWLRQDELYLPQAIYLLFQEEPYGIDEIADMTSCPAGAPVCPGGMDERRFSDLRTAFWLAYVCCEDKTLESLGNKDRLRVKMKDFLSWAFDRRGDVPLPDQFSFRLQELGITSVASRRAQTQQKVSALWLKWKSDEPNLTKNQAAERLKMMPDFQHLGIRTLRNNYLQGLGSREEKAGGRPKEFSENLPKML